MDLLAAMTTFVRVADASSLSKAAKALRVTPAAVSRQLTALEQELGATLLVRTTRQVALTEEGKRFYEHAQRTLGEAEDARASVRKDRAVAGLVVVSAPIAFGLSGFDASLVTLVAEHPGLRVDLRLEDHAVDLLADGIDVAIRAGLVPPDSANLVAQPLGVASRAVVASPGYLRRHGEPKQPSDLASHQAVVHLHAGTDVGVWTLHAGAGSTTLSVHGALRVSALHAVRNAVLAGAGLALVPRLVVAEDLAAGRLRALALGGWAPPPQPIYALIRAESRGRARVGALLENARAHVASFEGTSGSKRR
jgi:DNA-binding transcriptional LysR family regulator